MAAHFRFVKDHHKRIKKIAVVTDSAMGTLAEKLASHFVSATIKHFPAGQTQAARAVGRVLGPLSRGDPAMRAAGFNPVSAGRPAILVVALSAPSSVTGGRTPLRFRFRILCAGAPEDIDAFR
jgi:hypothetical protein